MIGRQDGKDTHMNREDLASRNPLRLLGYETDDILATGSFGAVCARAGVGKTAFLVQLALDSMLRKKNVLHISLNDPVDKTDLWYQEVFSNLVAAGSSAPGDDTLLHDILPHRFIMNFRAEGFSVPRFSDGLSDLVSGNIFLPEMVIIDGFIMDGTAEEPLSHLRTIAEEQSVHVWFTVRTHRHGETEPGRMPPPLSLFEDLFDVVLQLIPEGKDICVKCLKGAPSSRSPEQLLLNPSTMLVQSRQTTDSSS